MTGQITFPQKEAGMTLVERLLFSNLGLCREAADALERQADIIAKARTALATVSPFVGYEVTRNDFAQARAVLALIEGKEASDG